jgi:hypothetical protein
MENEKGNGQFLDLDQILPPAKTIRINNQDYYLSGEMTVKDNIEFLQKLRQYSDPSDPEAVQQMLEQISKFFTPYDPTMTAEKLGGMISISQLPALVKFIFAQMVEVPEDELKKKESETLETTS